MSKKLTSLILLTLIFCFRAEESKQNSRAAEFFEGLSAGDPLIHLMKLKYPSVPDFPFFEIPAFLNKNQKIQQSSVTGSQLAPKCSKLKLEPTSTYEQLQPKNPADGVLENFSIKFPFANLLSSVNFKGKNYCFAVNKKNIGFSFNTIQNLDVNGNENVGIHLESVSISNDNSLVAPNQVNNQII